MRPLIDPQTQAHLDRVIDLATSRRNYIDGAGARRAAQNLTSGQPAYWYRGRFSAASFVGSDANRVGLKEALLYFADTHEHFSITEDILDHLIPLNAPAIDEMDLAYRLQSTFREDLDRRERDAIYDPWYQPGIKLATRCSWNDEYEAIQARFEERRLNALPDASHPALALVLAAAQVEVA